MSENLKIKEITKELIELIPPIDLNLPELVNNQEMLNSLIADKLVMQLATNLLEEVESDKYDIEEIRDRFKDLIFNEGDSSSSSKEAITNLTKLKIDQTDKKIKLLELINKTKDKYRYKLEANQTNNINIGMTKSEKYKKLLEKSEDKK